MRTFKGFNCFTFIELIFADLVNLLIEEEKNQNLMVALNLSIPIAGKLSLKHLRAWLSLLVLLPSCSHFQVWLPTICDALLHSLDPKSERCSAPGLRSVKWLSKARAEVDARGLVFPLFGIWKTSMKLAAKLCVASLKCSLLWWQACCLAGVQNLAQALSLF